MALCKSSSSCVNLLKLHIKMIFPIAKYWGGSTSLPKNSYIVKKVDFSCGLLISRAEDSGKCW